MVILGPTGHSLIGDVLPVASWEEKTKCVPCKKTNSMSLLGFCLSRVEVLGGMRCLQSGLLNSCGAIVKVF